MQILFQFVSWWLAPHFSDSWGPILWLLNPTLTQISQIVVRHIFLIPCFKSHILVGMAQKCWQPLCGVVQKQKWLAICRSIGTPIYPTCFLDYLDFSFHDDLPCFPHNSSQCLIVRFHDLCFSGYKVPPKSIIPLISPWCFARKKQLLHPKIRAPNIQKRDKLGKCRGKTTNWHPLWLSFIAVYSLELALKHH